MKDIYLKIINQFKLQEKEIDILPLIDDIKFLKLVNAFKKIGVMKKRKTKKELIYKEINWNDLNEIVEYWNFLWNFFIFDYTEYEYATGLSNAIVRDFLEGLKNMRLIYPDGTINRFADLYIRHYIGMKLDQKKKLKNKKSDMEG